jgi:hypothetical protein
VLFWIVKQRQMIGNINRFNAGKEVGKHRILSEETKKAFELLTSTDKMNELIKSKQPSN